MITNIRLIISVVGFVLLSGGISYSLYTWHYQPIKALTKENKSKSNEIKAQSNTIRDLGVQITQLIEANKVSGFEEYFKGLADANNSINSNDLIF